MYNGLMLVPINVSPKIQGMYLDVLTNVAIVAGINQKPSGNHKLITKTLEFSFE